LRVTSGEPGEPAWTDGGDPTVTRGRLEMIDMYLAGEPGRS
jgi:hypothetical protein